MASKSNKRGPYKKKSAVQHKNMLKLHNQGLSFAVIAAKFGVGKSSVETIVKKLKMPTVTKAMKTQSVKRAVTESCRKLALKKINQTKDTRRRVVTYAEVVKYLQTHTKGLKIESDWIPSRRALNNLISAVPKAERTRKQRYFLVENEATEGEDLVRLVNSQKYYM